MLYLNDHLEDLDLGLALAQLSEQRREQALRFSHDAGRRTCAAAYLLLCEALRREYGITDNPLFEYGEHGKPSIVGHPEIYFNLSHCREAVACVVADHPVGIDVECIREFRDSLVNFAMNIDEVVRIQAAECPDVEFIRLWTMKEARLKLTGEGITDDIKTALSAADHFRFTTVERLDRNYIYTVCEERG